MKKNFRLVLALVLSIMMVLGSVALADTNPVVNSHTLTISNPDEKVQHTYEVYQVFKGNLNAAENTLSDVVWGDGVKSANLLTALHTASGTTGNELYGLFPDTVDTAAEFAEVLGSNAFTSTTGADVAAGKIDAVAAIIVANLDQKAKSDAQGNEATWTYDSTNHQYTTTVYADGYYLVKDATDNAALDGTNGSDTISKHLLQIVTDIAIVAKDTGTTTEKKIVEGNSEVNDNNAAIGDTITYKSTLNPIPNPTKYNNFKLEMTDTMTQGLTFNGISSITMGSQTMRFGDDYYYYVGDTAYGKDKVNNEYVAYSVTDAANTGAPSGSTTVRIIFRNAKNLILEGNDSQNKVSHVGEILTVNYTAILNKHAVLAPSSNDNTEKFIFSNDANSKYEGDEIKNTDPVGNTPEKTVETYTFALEILKVGEDGQTGLQGAIFTITGTGLFNVVREQGETFVKYTGAQGEVASEYTYWKLKDGSYTTTEPGSTVNGQVVQETQYVAKVNGEWEKYKKVTYTTTNKDIVAPTSTDTYEVVSGSDGYIRLEGLKGGTYTITETAAPDGYNKIDGTITVTVDWNHVHEANTFASPTSTQKETAKGGYTLTSAGGTNGFAGITVTQATNGAKITMTIQNNKGAVLPSTGGIGTTIFYIAGSVLVLAAAILLITKRRMGSND